MLDANILCCNDSTNSDTSRRKPDWILALSALWSVAATLNKNALMVLASALSSKSERKAEIWLEVTVDKYFGLG